jgi:ABC-type uncharacterized transport system substrate-binding protein
VRRAHAQAEIPNIPAMLQNFDGSDVDLIVPMTTPVISGACGLVKHKPVVFTYCTDPLAAGTGQSFTNHLPHMTGIGTFPPVQEMVNLIRDTVPGVKSVGTIYNASEANSRKVVEVARELFAKAGIKLEEARSPVRAMSCRPRKLWSAAARRRFTSQGDNTVAQAFDVVVKAPTTPVCRCSTTILISPRAERWRALGSVIMKAGSPPPAPSCACCWGNPRGIPIENVSGNG